MPAIRPDPPPQSAAQQSEQQQQQHFAAAMQATMTMQQALDNEEDTLVAEARGVGIAWPEIAAILPTRSMADLKRRHNTRIAAQVSSNAHAVANRGILLRLSAAQDWLPQLLPSLCRHRHIGGRSSPHRTASGPLTFTVRQLHHAWCPARGLPCMGRMPHFGISLLVS